MGQISFDFEPGPSPGGVSGALLTWDGFKSGPMQIRAANLAASLPEVRVV